MFCVECMYMFLVSVRTSYKMWRSLQMSTIVSVYWQADVYISCKWNHLVYNLFLVYSSISTCFRQLWADHQEKQMCFCDTLSLLFCVDDWLLCRVDWNCSFIPPCIPLSHPHRITSSKCCKNTFVSADDRPLVAWNM